MNCKKLNRNTGYSLFELIVVIVIVGIIVSVSVTSLKNSVEVARIEETKKELDQLALAISGNPQLVSGGNRVDFGYVGDIGSLPPNLDALVSNPGLGTWAGPYIRDDFYTSTGGSETEFKYDAWGVAYSYTGGITISSTGSGATISRQIANSTNDLLYNSVSLVITDIGNTPPGSIYKDSVQSRLTFPDGSGSYTTISKYPQPDGFVKFNSIPIGQQTLRVIYLPDNDTLLSKVIINPGQSVYAEISFNEDYW